MILFTSCTSQEVNNKYIYNVNNDSIKSIDIKSEEIYKEYDPREIISHVDYVHLELTEDNLIGEIDKVLIFNNYLFVLDRSQAKSVFCFGTNGKYLFKVGSLGSGPGEYRELVDILIDQKAEEIGLLTRSEILWYAINNGQFTGATTKFENQLIERVSYLDSTTLIGYANNQCGRKNDCSNYYIFDKLGEVFAQYLPVSKRERNLFIEYENPFSGDLITKSLTHLFNDTIYGITSEGRLYGKYYMNFGAMALKDRSTLPKKSKELSRWVSLSEEKKIVAGMQFFSETDSTIVLNFARGTDLFTTIYSKYTGKNITAKSLKSQGNAVGGISIGVHNNQFITSISGEILIAIQIALQTHENKDKIKKALAKELYDRALLIKDEANPTLIFTKYKSF